jgi:hypothetical protein
MEKFIQEFESNVVNIAIRGPESLRMSRSKQKKSRRLTNLVPKKYSLPKDHFGREI